jgi:urate oxidase
MERFASGWKRNYYGKGDVPVYVLKRGGARTADQPVFGANVTMLIYGEAFWPTYTTGDNANLIATDSMKNFIQRESIGFEGTGLERYCRDLGEKFCRKYPQVEGVQITAAEIPYDAIGTAALVPGGPERATAQIEWSASGLVDAVSGLRGFRLLRTGGSAFHGFVRDEYTTLPDLVDRPLHMWLDLEWRYTDRDHAFADPPAVARARRIVHETFDTFESGSIQQVIHRTGTRLLQEIPELAEVHLEAQNRTWDMVSERDQTSVYTEPRPPYGCLGLSLKR